MRKSAFYIDGGQAYIGYTNGDHWNGWATPYFTFEEAQKIQAEFSQGTNFPMLYDVNKDEFVIRYDDDDEPYIWKGEDIQTVDGVKHLYGIGAYSHIWDEFDSRDRRYLAGQVNEFLYDYERHDDDDLYDEDLTYEIIERLENLEICVKVYNIMNNSTIDKDQIYTKIGEELGL